MRAGLCVNLEVLDISENQIEGLPEEFMSLVNLVELNIAENAFVDVKKGMKLTHVSLQARGSNATLLNAMLTRNSYM